MLPTAYSSTDAPRSTWCPFEANSTTGGDMNPAGRSQMGAIGPVASAQAPPAGPPPARPLSTGQATSSLGPHAPKPHGTKELPSVGSAGHAFGTCRPCAFFYAKGCLNGTTCSFCHLCDRGEKKRRQKQKKASFKGGAWVAGLALGWRHNERQSHTLLPVHDCFHGSPEQKFSLEFRCTVLVQQLSIAGGCRGTVLANQHCCLEILLSQKVMNLWFILEKAPQNPDWNYMWRAYVRLLQPA